MPAFIKATVIDHQILKSQFHFLKLRPEKSVDFKAGQYIAIKINATKINKYSLTNRPGSPELELLIDTKPGQLGSQYIEGLKIADEIEFLGPIGIFTIQEFTDCDQILFIATGSGIAPSRSMIVDLLVNRRESFPISLYFGLRFQEDIFWLKEFEELSQQFTNFNFYLTLSRPEDTWLGLSGRVTEHLHKLDNLTTASAYLCGNSKMITDCQTILMAKGMEENKIYFESFYD